MCVSRVIDKDILVLRHGSNIDLICQVADGTTINHRNVEPYVARMTKEEAIQFATKILLECGKISHDGWPPSGKGGTTS